VIAVDEGRSDLPFDERKLLIQPLLHHFDTRGRVFHDMAIFIMFVAIGDHKVFGVAWYTE
jgi:hypothetical protein